jgi:hypothetical protein
MPSCNSSASCTGEIWERPLAGGNLTGRDRLANHAQSGTGLALLYFRNQCWIFNKEEFMSDKGNKRIKGLLALWMVGEGIIGALRPKRYLQLWRFGPKGYREFIDALTDHPNSMRLLCAAEAGVGIWWALRQISK